jgi:hypothetical protein
MTEAHQGVQVAALPGEGLMPDYTGQGSAWASNDELAREAISNRDNAEWRQEQRRKRNRGERQGLGGFIRRVFGN